MSKPILAYWDIRGLAQPIRLLLNYTGTDFEDKYYVTGTAPTFDKSCWFDIKFSLGLDFSNLPYYNDGNVKLTQSNAILRYIGRKNNLLGSTAEEQTRVDLMENQAADFRDSWVSLCYNPKFEELKSGYAKSLPDKLKAFSDYLGERKWFAGKDITIVDFVMYEMLDQHLIFDPTCLDNFANLKDLVERFRALDKIEAYMKSDKFLTKPLNNRMAKFGSETA